MQTAEGALTETHSILQRMRELATQSASDTNDDGVDRAALDAEFQQLKLEIDDIASKTAFNGKKLLDGTFGSTATVDAGSGVQAGLQGVTKISLEGFAAGAHTITFDLPGATGTNYTAEFDGTTISFAQPAAGGGSFTLDFGGGQVVTVEMGSHVADSLDGDTLDFTVAGNSAKIQTGANEGDSLSISIDSMKAADLGLTASAIGNQANAELAITAVNTAINSVSTQRATLGATQNRLDHKINNLDTSSENLQAAESRIRDLDMAKEMTTFTKNNILTQAATAMLAQANQAPQNVLSLLR